VANLAVLNSIKPEDKSESLQSLFDEVQDIASLFTNFLEGAIMALLKKQLGSDLPLYGTEEEILPTRKSDEIAIPIFYQLPAE